MSTGTNNREAGQAIRFVRDQLRKQFDKLDVRAVGAENTKLKYHLDPATGYWGTNDAGKTPIQNPPRLILQVDVREQPPRVHFPVDPKTGAEYSQARTVGYITHGGCHFVLVTALVALRTDAAQFHFPEGWEWVVIFAFNPALPSDGKNTEPLKEFDPVSRTINFTGSPRAIAYIGIGTCCSPTDSVQLGEITVTYGEITEALCDSLGVETAAEGAEEAKMRVRSSRAARHGTADRGR